MATATPLPTPAPAPPARSPASPARVSPRFVEAGSTPGGTPLWKEIVDDVVEGVVSPHGFALPISSGKYTRVFCADAGFGCVPMVVYAAKKGIAIIACVKKYHAGFPQERLAKEMETARSGCWLTATCTIDGAEVVAVAYKYNAKKTLFFLAPVGAGSLLPGTSYVSRFPDLHLNVNFREVLRPALLSRYFAYSPKVSDFGSLSARSATCRASCHTFFAPPSPLMLKDRQPQPAAPARARARGGVGHERRLLPHLHHPHRHHHDRHAPRSSR